MDASEYKKIRQLFDDYLRMYSSRDDRLTTHFSEDFSGFTGGGDFLIKDKVTIQKKSLKRSKKDLTGFLRQNQNFELGRRFPVWRPTGCLIAP
jgi:hypothetical protein